jgi:hypothetical protein
VIILAVIAGTIIAVIMYLLFVPIFFRLSYKIDTLNFKQLEIRLFPLTIHPGKSKGKDVAKMKRAKDKKEKKRKKKGRTYKITFIPLMQNEYATFKHVIIDVIRLISGIIKSPENQSLRVELAGGLSAPDFTGYLYGAVCLIRPYLGKPVLLSFSPDFTSQSLRGEVSGELSIRIANLIKQVLLFLWRLPKLRLIKIYFNVKRGGKYGRQVERAAVVDYKRA